MALIISGWEYTCRSLQAEVSRPVWREAWRNLSRWEARPQSKQAAMFRSLELKGKPGAGSIGAGHISRIGRLCCETYRTRLSSCGGHDSLARGPGNWSQKVLLHQWQWSSKGQPIFSRSPGDIVQDCCAPKSGESWERMWRLVRSGGLAEQHWPLRCSSVSGGWAGKTRLRW